MLTIAIFSGFIALIALVQSHVRKRDVLLLTDQKKDIEERLMSVDLSEVEWRREMIEGEIDKLLQERNKLEIETEGFRSELRQRERKLAEFDHKEAVVTERARLEANESFKLSDELSQVKEKLENLKKKFKDLEGLEKKLSERLAQIENSTLGSLLLEKDVNRVLWELEVSLLQNLQRSVKHVKSEFSRLNPQASEGHKFITFSWLDAVSREDTRQIKSCVESHKKYVLKSLNERIHDNIVMNTQGRSEKTESELAEVRAEVLSGKSQLKEITEESKV